MAKFRITPEQIRSLFKSKKEIAPKPNKFGAKPTHVDGIRFASKKEASYYNLLKDKMLDEEISYFLMQVPFRLPGGVKYLADFMVVYPDNRIEFIDVKGRDTPISILKRKQVLDIFGIEIQIV